MITELCFVGAAAAIGINSIHDCIKYKEVCGRSYKNDVVKEFDRFVKNCKDYKTARVVFFLPTLKGSSSFSFLYGIEVKGNIGLIREALKTNNFTKIIYRENIDFEYMKHNEYKFESVPLSNRFQINFYND